MKNCLLIKGYASQNKKRYEREIVMGYTHGTKWTDELIKEKVLEVVKALKIDRMPTRSECVNYFHDGRLANAISKRCGWYSLAKELDLDIKESETTFGKRYETIAEELLQELGFQVRRMSQNFPYDLLVDDCVKVDVKASRLYKGKLGNFYSFNLEKPYATCDIYLLFAINDSDEIEKTMVVPSKNVIAQNQISVGEYNSKYHKYTERFDLIKAVVGFWGKVEKDRWV